MLVVERCRTWAWKMRRAGLPDLGAGSIFHVANGGLRTKSEAARLKAMGVRAGVADLFLPVMVERDGSVFGGLWVEMKRQAGPKGGGGTLSKEQIEFGEEMRGRGYEWKACHGAKEALQSIGDYLGMVGVGLQDFVSL